VNHGGRAPRTVPRHKIYSSVGTATSPSKLITFLLSPLSSSSAVLNIKYG
jgi:hypothetical protein